MYACARLQEGASHERCERVVLSALKHQAECGAPQLQCTFNGAWGGPRVPKVGSQSVGRGDAGGWPEGRNRWSSGLAAVG